MTPKKQTASRRFHPFLLIAALTLAISAHAADPNRGYVHTNGSQLVDGQGHTLNLRGASLGNWMVPEGYMFRLEQDPQSPREIEALLNELLGPIAATRFWHDYRDRYVTRADIQFLQHTGYNSIRIPIDYRFFTPGNEEGFTLLDRVIGWAQEAGLYIVIDIHAAPCGQTGTNIDNSWGYPWLFESPECQQQTVDIWKRIAAHYRDSKTVLGYDLLNEPIPPFPQLQIYNARLEPLYRRMVAGIREVDTHHVVILGGAQWDTNFSVFGPPFDSNVMYTFHKYWMSPSSPLSRPISTSGTAITCPCGWENPVKTPTHGSANSGSCSTKTRLAGPSGPTKRWKNLQLRFLSIALSTGTRSWPSPRPAAERERRKGK